MGINSFPSPSTRLTLIFPRMMEVALMQYCRVYKIFILLVFLALLAMPATAREAAPSREGILLVAFGTSVPDARPSFDSIGKYYKAEFPGVPVVWAFTSQIIRKKLAKQGIQIGGIADGLAKLAKDGVKTARVQSLHMMAGAEFAALARSVLINIQKHPGRFDAVYLGRPLLESERDADEAAKALLGYLEKKREPGEAIVLMGHGHDGGRADLVFDGARSRFKLQDPLVFMATVEGSRGFDDLQEDLEKAKVQKALLAPLMIVAGDHARNDLAGDEADSWASRLKKSGIAVRSGLTGLGEIPGIDAIFARHTRESTDNLCLEPVKP